MIILAGWNEPRPAGKLSNVGLKKFADDEMIKLARASLMYMMRLDMCIS